MVYFNMSLFLKGLLMETWPLIMGRVPAPTPRTLLHHGWLLIYKATMQSLMSKLKTGKIAVVSKYFNAIVQKTIVIKPFLIFY